MPASPTKTMTAKASVAALTPLLSEEGDDEEVEDEEVEDVVVEQDVAPAVVAPAHAVHMVDPADAEYVPVGQIVVPVAADETITPPIVEAKPAGAALQ